MDETTDEVHPPCDLVHTLYGVVRDCRFRISAEAADFHFLM